MGLTKQYLRYVPAGNFNIIASQGCNIVFVSLDSQEGRFVAVGACEHIIIWDLRLGEKAQILSGEKATVTHLCASPNKQQLAAGYSDGNVQVYDLKTAEVVSIFSGHKNEITCLSYDSFGHKLASGSKDTDIIVWDTVAEVGLCRLSGHKGPITQICFMAEQNVLISASKDTFVKFWDLDTHHCFKTLIGHRTEVWGITLMKDDQYLVSGCGDSELRVWKLTERDPDAENKTPVEQLALTLELTGIDDSNDTTHPLQCVKVGSLLRGGKGRVISMFSDITGQVIGCHGSDFMLEIFHFLPNDEAELRFKKRLKKEKKKEDDTTPTTEANDPTTLQLSLVDEVKRLPGIKLETRPKSFHLVLGFGGELRVAVTLANNTVQLYSVQTGKGAGGESRSLRTISSQGHQSEVRTVSFSSDSLAVVSGSGDAVKLWNRGTQASLRTVVTGYVLSTIFVPGDRHVLAGLKDGKLLIVDVAAGDVLEEIPAHTTELWSICALPDMRGCITGGGDKTVKFWQYELVTDDESEIKAKVLSLIHTRTLKLEDSVLCVKISPCSKFIAVALLDSTVKIFFVDTFKFYLSLYGHKLPVLCMDISSDSAMIATGSADRNVKLWGMDFGDCHKSIFAHDDSITGVQFVPKTHYFFTCGKDGQVKEWDGDSYNKIISLHGHIGEAWGLSVSSNGQYLVTCGSDRVIRLFEKTDQAIVLQDEEEEEREANDTLATGDQTFVPGQPGLNLPSKKTVGSEKAAESIMECLEVCAKFQEQLEEHASLQAASTQPLAPPQIPLIMQAYKVTTPDDYLIEIFRRIRSSDLEESLLILPFTTVIEVFQRLVPLSSRGDHTELICKLVTFMLKIHHAPIVANHALLSTLRTLQKNISVKTEELRDMVAYNYYGMQYLQREIEAKEGIQLFKDATQQRRKGEKKRKQREKLKRSIMVLS